MTVKLVESVDNSPRNVIDKLEAQVNAHELVAEADGGGPSTSRQSVTGKETPKVAKLAKADTSVRTPKVATTGPPKVIRPAKKVKSVVRNTAPETAVTTAPEVKEVTKTPSKKASCFFFNFCIKLQMFRCCVLSPIDVIYCPNYCCTFW